MEIENDPRYVNGKIYKIVCNITNEVYYGSTIKTLNGRLSSHTRRKTCICRNIINRGNYKIELIKDYPCNSKYELEEEEGKYIRENECINIVIPHRTDKEYYVDNKEKIKEQNKEYREDNKEKLKEKNKEYYEKNINKKKKKAKEYYEDNKEEIKNKKKIYYEKNKKYYENNKEEIKEQKKEKITCECGAIVRRGGIAEHKKSMKHLQKMECIIID